MRLFRPAYHSLRDETLMGHVTQGDERAFDELYRRYSEKLLHYFYRMLNQEEARAQDLLQDLFMKVVEKPQLFDPNRTFSTWLFAIASNMIKNEYRSRQVRSVMTYPEDMSQLDITTDTLEEALNLQHFGQTLQGELQFLSEAHREVFLLRYQEGMSIREISEIVTCSEGTVKSRLYYALRNLAQRLRVFDPKA